MRTRIKTACCSHATPDGKAIMGRKEILKEKFQNDDITTSELREYASFMIKSKSQPITSVMVSVFGTLQRVSYNDYITHYKPQGYEIKEVVRG